jgi:hypothetical protein
MDVIDSYASLCGTEDRILVVTAHPDDNEGVCVSYSYRRS